MLREFRNRYPTGSLICELMTIYDGSYVVRAIVELEGKVIATGLAAAHTVEEAEDRAQIRALDVLGLSPHRVEPNPGEIPSEIVPDPVSPILPLTEISEPSQRNPSAWESPGEEADRSPETDRELTDIEPSIEPSIEPTDDVERLTNRTTVEIRRLGWNAAQGRRYLEEKYEKRSRQHLTREELIEFLAYLESQPTP